MSTAEILEPPSESAGSDGDPCPSCGSPLAADQRYCLNCGRSRGDDRVPYRELLAGHSADQVMDGPPEPPRRRRIPAPVSSAAAGAVGAVLLGVGVLAGALIAGDDEPPPQTVAQAPVQKAPVVNITNSGGGGGTEEAAASEFTPDWPDGKSGYTVQLQALPNTDTAGVAAAKQDATSKGAKDVGALNSDDYPSLDPGKYVVYSGVFAGKKGKAQATAALKGLKGKFKDAKVVKVAPDPAAAGSEGTKPEEVQKTVSKSALTDLQNSTGTDQQKKSAKLPDTLKLPGKVPEADKKAPNNGKGGGEAIE